MIVFKFEFFKNPFNIKYNVDKNYRAKIKLIEKN